MEKPMIEIRNFSKSFQIHENKQRIDAVYDINLTLNKGEFVGITGKSGSGKSTILKGIYRTNYPDRGEIWYDSLAYGRIDLLKAQDQQVIHLRKHEIGYVSQFLRIMPRVNAIEYVESSVREIEKDENRVHQLAIDILTHFELDPSLWYLTPNTFSGGEKLRLNIAAAMVKKPRILLLDEPTASLDQHSKLKVKQLIEKLKSEQTTMLGIFHDLEFMSGLIDREFHLEKQHP